MWGIIHQASGEQADLLLEESQTRAMARIGEMVRCGVRVLQLRRPDNSIALDTPAIRARFGWR